MQWTTDFEGRTYRYIQKGARACLLEDGRVLWWGDPSQRIPSTAAPLVVLLTFSLARRIIT